MPESQLEVAGRSSRGSCRDSDSIAVRSMPQTTLIVQTEEVVFKNAISFGCNAITIAFNESESGGFPPQVSAEFPEGEL
jgi:hypothetical protein